MLEMMNGLQSGGSFSGITPPHCGAQDSHFIRVVGNVCTSVVLWIIFHLCSNNFILI